MGRHSQGNGGEAGKVGAREELCPHDRECQSEPRRKLESVAQNQGIELGPPNPQTEEGKSLTERMKAEATLLGSLEGDAFDKEYMTLVTNTQQSVLNMLKASKGSAKDPEVKQLVGEMTTTIQNRLKTAQDVMSKIYGQSEI